MSKQPEALRLADLAGGHTGLTVDEAESMYRAAITKAEGREA